MTIQEKYEFLLSYEQKSKILNVIQIAEDFGIKKSQAYNIINLKDKIINDFKAIENVAESKELMHIVLKRLMIRLLLGFYCKGRGMLH